MKTNRVQTALPPRAMKTYQVVAPQETHFRPATCAEVECPHHLYGWRTIVDSATELGQRQIQYIKNESGRRFTSFHVESGLVTFTFEAGQECFVQHRIRLDNEALYFVRGGDWRGNPLGETKQHANADDWVDDFANHQQVIADRIKRG